MSVVLNCGRMESHPVRQLESLRPHRRRLFNEINAVTYLDRGSSNLPTDCIWNIRSPPPRYSMTKNRWSCQSINQSINQPTNQKPTKPSIYLSINHSVGQSVSQSINQSVNQSINQSIDRSINPSINQWINCWFARDVTAAMLMVKSKSISLL